MTPLSNSLAIGETLERLETKLDSLSERFAGFQTLYAERHQAVIAETQRAHQRVDRLEKDLSEVTADMKEIHKLMPWVKAQAYIMTALAVPVILAASAFFWQVVTHQVLVP